MTSEQQPTRVTCPTWCTSDWADHQLDELDGRRVVWHPSPGFGGHLVAMVASDAETGELRRPELVGEIDGETLSPLELRELAIHAMAAADWLEEQA